MAEETLNSIARQGSDFVEGLSTMDSWCFVFHKGGEVFSDALSTSETTQEGFPDVSPLSVAITVPRKPCEYTGMPFM